MPALPFAKFVDQARIARVTRACRGGREFDRSRSGRLAAQFKGLLTWGVRHVDQRCLFNAVTRALFAGERSSAGTNYAVRLCMRPFLVRRASMLAH